MPSSSAYPDTSRIGSCGRANWTRRARSVPVMPGMRWSVTTMSTGVPLSSSRSASSAELRAFLRYLATQGHCRAGLDNAVPAYAHWQLAEMPRYISNEQVSRLIAACYGDAVARRRDRAIVLLLARLGLRAGDVAQLRLIDIEWQAGSLRVTGKSRHEVRLPLPQDVGDAVAAYLECRPSFCRSDRVFLSTIAPSRPFLNGDAFLRWSGAS